MAAYNGHGPGKVLDQRIVWLRCQYRKVFFRKVLTLVLGSQLTCSHKSQGCCRHEDASNKRDVLPPAVPCPGMIYRY